jgi:hypothetical protein
MKYMSLTYMPNERHTPIKMYTREMHIHETHSHEIGAYEKHACSMYVL